jgi:hypothetical protein
MIQSQLSTQRSTQLPNNTSKSMLASKVSVPPPKQYLKSGQNLFVDL